MRTNALQQHWDGHQTVGEREGGERQLGEGSCCFAEDGTEMYQHVKRTCKACRVVVSAH